jgi:hypothetical protein
MRSELSCWKSRHEGRQTGNLRAAGAASSRRAAHDDDRDVHDATLIEELARAFYWQQLLDADALASGSAIADAERLYYCVVNELLRLI